MKKESYLVPVTEEVKLVTESFMMQSGEGGGGSGFGGGEGAPRWPGIPDFPGLF